MSNEKGMPMESSNEPREMTYEELDAAAGGGSLVINPKLKIGWKCSGCPFVWTKKELEDNHYNCPHCGNFLFPDPARMGRYYV